MGVFADGGKAEARSGCGFAAGLMTGGALMARMALLTSMNKLEAWRKMGALWEL